MPEEINGLVTDRLADPLLTTSIDAVAHLGNEGVAPGPIHFVGNPLSDTLLANLDGFDAAGSRSKCGVASPYPVAAGLFDHRQVHASAPSDTSTSSAWCEVLQPSPLTPVVMPVSASLTSSPPTS